jgi:hypothetical protein
MTASSWHLGGIWDARFLLFIQASELSNPDPPAPRSYKKLDPSGVVQRAGSRKPKTLRREAPRAKKPGKKKRTLQNLEFVVF